MTHRIDDLIQKIRELEEELEIEFKTKREEFQFIIEEKRVRFAEEVARQQRRLKTGLYRYITRAHPLNILTAPVIYSRVCPVPPARPVSLDLSERLFPDLRDPQGQALGVPRLRPHRSALPQRR
jgi:hypothetical protein